jgi:DNA-binding CsgD family transcriptional regulator
MPTLGSMPRRPSVRETLAATDRLAAVGPRDVREFRAAVVEVLARAVGFDWFVWVLTDPATEVGVDPFAVVPDLGQLSQLVRLKYLTSVNRWTQLGSVASLGVDPERSPLWSAAQRQHGVVDVTSAVFRDGFGCWGFLDLWSTRHPSRAELDLLSQLVPVLTRGLRRGQSLSFADAAESQPSPPGAAVILLDDELCITGQTSTSRSWLARLLPPTDSSDPVPAAALNVAAQLLAREAGVDNHPAAARVHLSHGEWVTLKAARLEPGGMIAVTLESSTAAERLDLFARSHALSVRERQLLTILAEGADTKKVAAQMFVSEHTVQDHLKSVFRKTGTHNRRTLLSHAVGIKAEGG